MMVRKILWGVCFILLFLQSVLPVRQSDIRSMILIKNTSSVFLNDLENASEQELKSASVLLGAKIKGVRDTNDQKAFALARKIDLPVVGAWSDIAIQETTSFDENGYIKLDDIKKCNIKSIVSTFVLNTTTTDEDIQQEIHRATNHLINHDVKRSHVISDLKERKSDASFFFLCFSLSNTSLNKEQFLEALIGLVFNKFSQGNFSVEKSDVGRSCFQVIFDFDVLFSDSTVIFGIKFYKFNNFLFVPICNSYIAKNIALRFTIQKCRGIKRLYLMTLFPLNKSSTYLSDKRLKALTVLNEFSVENNTKMTLVDLDSVDIPPSKVVLIVENQMNMSIEACCPQLEIERQDETDVDIPPQIELATFPFHCLIL